MREDGRQTWDWRPTSMEISDATGNRWRTYSSSSKETAKNGEIAVGFLGVLWPGEAAWKLKLEFNRVAEFPEKEFLRIKGLPIPGPTEWHEHRIEYQVNGATVNAVALVGSGVDWGRLSQANRDPLYRFESGRIAGGVTVLIAGKILSRDRRLRVISINDEHGKNLEIQRGLSEPQKLISGVTPDEHPYSLNLKTHPESTKVDLVLALTPSVRVEFVARPEQVPLPVRNE